MMTLIAAAALATQAPTLPANSTANHAQHQESAMAEKKGMDCCKDCCKDMEKMHSGHDLERMPDHQQHGGHSGR